MVGQSVIRVAAEKPYFSKALRVRPGRKLPTDLPAYSDPGRLRAKLTASRGGTCDGARWRVSVDTAAGSGQVSSGSFEA